MNLGRSAGAGVAGHVHMHILRAGRRHQFHDGDRETRVLPEDLR